MKQAIEKMCVNYADREQERPDLVAIDKEGNIVIIELKRDDSGSMADWQAIKYAAYWSNFRFEDIITVYQDYLHKYHPSDSAEAETAEQRILEFIEEPTADTINVKQRIIIASHRFAREVISATKWLIDQYHISIKCIQLIPYHDQDQNLFYIQSFQLLPLPALDDLIIRASTKATTITGSASRKKDDKVTHACFKIKELVVSKIGFYNNTLRTSWWAGTGYSGRYFHFWFSDTGWNNHSLSYRLHMGPDGFGEASISLLCNTSFMSTIGASKGSIDQLKNALRSISLQDFRFSDDGQYLMLIRTLTIHDFSEAETKAIAESISELITATKDAVDSAFSGEQ